MAMPAPRVPDEELRCDGGLLGILKDGLLEIKCRHWACTRGNNITYHYFDPLTGQLVDTIRYKDPMNKEK
jgi:hypothetical protein